MVWNIQLFGINEIHGNFLDGRRDVQCQKCVKEHLTGTHISILREEDRLGNKNYNSTEMAQIRRTGHYGKFSVSVPIDNLRFRVLTGRSEYIWQELCGNPIFNPS